MPEITKPVKVMPPELITVSVFKLMRLPTAPNILIAPEELKLRDWLLIELPSIVELKLILPFDPVPVLVSVVKA